MGAMAIDEMENRRSWRLNFGLDVNDARQFATSYVACFVAVTAFIAWAYSAAAASASAATSLSAT